MVAVIHSSKSLRNILAYNENKVRQAHANLIYASGYAKDLDQLTAADRIGMLRKRNELNSRCKINTLHVSLNFHPDEKLTIETLQQISESYMAKIGFGSQPYLVYQHHDSSHPHLHIVTTNIRPDGSRISLHNLGKMQSESARKEIEIKFGLVRAGTAQQVDIAKLKSTVKKIQYEQSNPQGLKKAIADVLLAILPTYKFTSLPELNAVLAQYQLLADRGSKESRIYKHNGLVYRVLDKQGKTVGVPIPASAFKFPATLKYLNRRFQENISARDSFKVRIRNSVDTAFHHKAIKSFDSLQHELSKENIHLVLRKNEKRVVYGLTYIDHKTRCVFNGSDIGKAYSANAINARIYPNSVEAASIRKLEQSVITTNGPWEPQNRSQYKPEYWQVFTINRDLVKTLMQPEGDGAITA
ncbi:MAG: relaxase/mobilization nuclease domain-containing protein, partial [Chitinophagaceae bacterium]|nr:relaxase/mobilization nuclease domain-containing protein [Chitinophagaceae bacterium]